MGTVDVDETWMHVDENSADENSAAQPVLPGDNSAAQPVLPRDPNPGTALALPDQDAFTVPPELRPVIEVAFKSGQWWSIPEEMSKEIYRTSLMFQCVVYTWDWDDTRPGSFVIHADDGSTQATSINRYMLDFQSMTQTNIDNQRKRTFRVCWTKDAGPARWTGQITG